MTQAPCTVRMLPLPALTGNPGAQHLCLMHTLSSYSTLSGVQQLSALPYDASVLLVSARQKARHIYKCEQWDVKSITEPDKPSCLSAAVDVQTAC
eukprot:14414-Heterococcus_DN1.PRE.6